jgi:hypothetical protein
VGASAVPVAARRPRIWPWIVTIVVGIALTATGFGLFVGRTIVGLFSHQASYTPYAKTTQLDAGTYYVFEATSSFGGLAGPRITPDDVAVTSDATGAVPSFRPSGSETISSDGTSFQTVVGFLAEVAGSYRVRVASPGGTRVPIFVAPSIGTSLRSGVGWLGLAGVGGVVALVGFVVLIAQLVRRGRTRGPPRFAPRCSNGHPVRPTDRFCAACGAPVYPIQATVPTP